MFRNHFIAEVLLESEYHEINGRYAVFSKELYTKLLQNIIYLDRGHSLCSDYILESELDK